LEYRWLHALTLYLGVNMTYLMKMMKMMKGSSIGKCNYSTLIWYSVEYVAMCIRNPRWCHDEQQS
jgi:hypothetical protein